MARPKKHWLLDKNWWNSELIAGAQLRHDRIGTLGLFNTVNRARTETVRDDKVQQTASALFGELKTPWTSWLRSTVGLRYDTIHAEIDPQAGAFNLNNGGQVTGAPAQSQAGPGAFVLPFAGVVCQLGARLSQQR